MLIKDQDSPIASKITPVDGKPIKVVYDLKNTSTDFGSILLATTAEIQDLTQVFADSINDKRDQSHITYTIKDLIDQRVAMIGCGYLSVSDASDLRDDPMMKLAVGNSNINDDGSELSSPSTLNRMENSLSIKDIYRLCQAQVESYIASQGKAPKGLVMDMDHSEDITYGDQEFTEYNGYYKSTCYLPLFIHDGMTGQLILSVLRSGVNASGKENAAILKRVITLIQSHWPDTDIILRGDSKFGVPEIMKLEDEFDNISFTFGMAKNSKLNQLAIPYVEDAEYKFKSVSGAVDQITEYDSFEYQAKSWDKAYRIIIITTVSKDNLHFRFIITDLYNIHPRLLYEKLYCHRGNQELYIKELKGDFRSDLTPCKQYTANFFRVLLASLVYNIIVLLRKDGLKGTQFANATAARIKLKLFKMAVKVVSCKDRIILHLPESCPYKKEMSLLMERLFQTHKFINTSLP